MRTRWRIAALERSLRRVHRKNGVAEVMPPREMIALLLGDPGSAEMAGRCADMMLTERGGHAIDDAERAGMEAALVTLMTRAESLVRERRCAHTAEVVAA